MALSTPWLRRIALLALAISLLTLAISGWMLLQAQVYNQALSSEDWQQAAAHPSAYGALAAAYQQATQQPQQDFQTAVKALADVATATDDPQLKQLARYNLATLYLQRGLQLLGDEQYDQAFPLVELAKEIYREHLRTDPSHWDSKYNLEQALRAVPDVAEQETEAERNPERSSRAVTATRSRRELP